MRACLPATAFSCPPTVFNVLPAHSRCPSFSYQMEEWDESTWSAACQCTEEAGRKEAGRQKQEEEGREGGREGGGR